MVVSQKFEIYSLQNKEKPVRRASAIPKKKKGKNMPSNITVTTLKVAKHIKKVRYNYTFESKSIPLR